MALIACPECSRQVSDTAPACPGCGAPVASLVAQKRIESERSERAVPPQEGGVTERQSPPRASSGLNTRDVLVLAVIVLTIVGYVLWPRLQRVPKEESPNQAAKPKEEIPQQAAKPKEESPQQAAKGVPVAKHTDAKQASVVANAPAPTSTPPAGLVFVSGGKCKMAVSKSLHIGNPNLKHVWEGACVQGVASGTGIDRTYDPSNKLVWIAKSEFERGVRKKVLEGYSARTDGIYLLRSKPDGEPSRALVPPSRVPAWAREVTASTPPATAQSAPPRPSPAAPASQPSASAPSQFTQRVFLAERTITTSRGPTLEFYPILASNESAADRMMGAYVRRIRFVDPYTIKGCLQGEGQYFAFVGSLNVNAAQSTGWAICGADTPAQAAEQTLNACRRAGKCGRNGFYIELVVSTRKVEGADEVLGLVGIGNRRIDSKHNILEGWLCIWQPDGTLDVDGPFARRGSRRDNFNLSCSSLSR